MVSNAASIYSRESEDTMLMILKEVYSSVGIAADNHVPQQSILADRSTSSLLSHSATSGDADISRVLDSVEANEETELVGCQSDFVMSSQVASSPVTTYSVDVSSSASSLTTQSETVASALVSNNAGSGHLQMGMDPTAPLTENKNLGPPPMTGFVRK
jgi:hypothetical protein